MSATSGKFQAVEIPRKDASIALSSILGLVLRFALVADMLAAWRSGCLHPTQTLLDTCHNGTNAKSVQLRTQNASCALSFV